MLQCNRWDILSEKQDGLKVSALYGQQQAPAETPPFPRLPAPVLGLLPPSPGILTTTFSVVDPSYKVCSSMANRLGIATLE